MGWFDKKKDVKELIPDIIEFDIPKRTPSEKMLVDKTIALLSKKNSHKWKMQTKSIWWDGDKIAVMISDYDIFIPFRVQLTHEEKSVVKKLVDELVEIKKLETVNKL